MRDCRFALASSEIKCHSDSQVRSVDVIGLNEYYGWYNPNYEELIQLGKNSNPDKPVIITETGWPSAGSPYGGAIPGDDNALNYFIQTYEWARQEDLEIFYFSSFDEAWKTGDEGDVGCYWGLWDAAGNLKFV